MSKVNNQEFFAKLEEVKKVNDKSKGKIFINWEEVISIKEYNDSYILIPTNGQKKIRIKK